ncbi:hypothetical protein AVEN_180284-1 [Araneus ventricosus]|uniref:Uncharacterized protein n=1 Tax=Araneus ventricosus TaxID=182803 RepID=A0A4Y2BH34_ARAVE|nr:hypothetical protein AVEN_28533-1 [Araneus ventricosus]GBL90475.1 hypothetical protein AVEN_180284-1 [Araneus ventricosus]
MEKQLKCVLLLSLKEMALRRVAVLLWSDSDISASILKFPFYGYGNKEWEKILRETILDKVVDKASKLQLPKSLTKQMIDIVLAIGVEIRRWKDMHYDIFSILFEDINLPVWEKLCWTTGGTIDDRKTAEALVRCNVLDVETRFQLACLYCLEDYIPLLWEELPGEMKDLYQNENGSSDLYFCWPHVFKGELSKLDYLLRIEDRKLTSYNQWAFEQSVEDDNKIAAENFFLKLTHEEREASLMRSAHAVLGNNSFDKEMFSGVVCYLLSVMTPEQQMEAIKAHPVHVLLCFLDLPLRDLFLENVGLIWTFLPPSGYDDLLGKVGNRFNYSGRYFPKFFQEFFMLSPLDFKKWFVVQESQFNTPYACRFLYMFLKFEDSESIEVIFRNVDAADRLKLVFHPHLLKHFYNCMLDDRWHMVEVCLREATLSKEDRKRLSEAFMGFLRMHRIEWENTKLKRFFEFLDETDASADKGKKAQKRKLENCCRE